MIHCLVPLMIHSSPTLRALVFRAHRSEPASGSVAPKQVVFSPASRCGTMSVLMVSLALANMWEGPSVKPPTRGVVRKPLEKPIIRWPAPCFL